MVKKSKKRKNTASRLTQYARDEAAQLKDDECARVVAAATAVYSQPPPAPASPPFISEDPLGEDTIQKPPDRVFLIAHFSAWRSPRGMRIALSGSHMLAGSNGTKPLAPPCAPNPRRVIN